jgi:hypothetical protein
LDSLIPF